MEVVLSAASTNTVTVQFATSDGTASAPGDYASNNGTLTFAPGVTSQFITIQIVNDNVAENSETASIALSNPQNATLGMQLFSLTITDDDGGGGGPPTPCSVQLSSATYSVSEGGGTATITVTVMPASNSAVTVQYATSNGTATGL